MFNSKFGFASVLVVMFVMLTAGWVSAQETYEVVREGHAAEPVCRKVGDGVVMCEGTPYLLQPAPRGTVKRLPQVSLASRARAGERIGTTVIVARLGR